MRTLFVCHAMRGCETGCCGSVLALDPDGEETLGRFAGDHPRDGESPEAFARRTWPLVMASGDVVQVGSWDPWQC